MMIRKISVVLLLILLLLTQGIPVMAAGGNGGSTGSNGQNSGGSEANGNSVASAGNVAGGAAVPSGTGGSQTQVIQQAQGGVLAGTMNQSYTQINQQDRTNVSIVQETTSPDLLRQNDRDLYLQQVSLQQQDLSSTQDRVQAH